MKNFFFALITVLLILLVTFAFSSISQNPETKDVSFINEAVKKAKTANKLLIIEFWAPECDPSLKLTEDIFGNDEIREFLDSNFLIVKVSPADPAYFPLWDHFKLNYKSSVIFLDINGNEIDRSVSYDGNREAYLNFLKEVSEGRNLYCQVFMAYKKDSLDIRNNYLLANKFLFRYQVNEAVIRFNKVLSLDPHNKKGLNNECRIKITESENLEKLKSQ